jgi:hypothetical protein
MSVPASQNEVKAEVTKGHGLDLMAAEFSTGHIGLRNSITETTGVRKSVQQKIRTYVDPWVGRLSTKRHRRETSGLSVEGLLGYSRAV